MIKKGRYGIVFLVLVFLWLFHVNLRAEDQARYVYLCNGENYICDTFYDAQQNQLHINIPTPTSSTPGAYVHTTEANVIEYQLPDQKYDQIYDQRGLDLYLHIYWSPEPEVSVRDTILCPEKVQHSFTWYGKTYYPPFQPVYYDQQSFVNAPPNFADLVHCPSVDRTLNVTVYDKQKPDFHDEGTTCSSPVHYQWPDGTEEDLSIGPGTTTTFTHIIKSKLPCKCDSMECTFTLKYVMPTDFTYHAILCTNKDNVYIPRFDTYLSGLGQYDYTIYASPESTCIDTSYHVLVEVQNPPLIWDEKDTSCCYDPTGFEWRGLWIIDEGTYTVTDRATLCDCDSVIHTIHLKYNYPSYVTEDVYRCTGETYTYTNMQDPSHPITHNITSNTSFTESWKNMYGCDSTYRLNIHFSEPPISKDCTFTICAADTFIEHGSKRLITTTGTYLDTIFCKIGAHCDSVHWKYVVTRLDTTNSFENYRICYTDRPFKWHGKEFYRSIRTKDTLLNSVGCDSFCYMNLYVTDAPYNEPHDTIMCLGHPFMWGNKFVDEKGTYIDTINNIYSCDSVYRVIKVDTLDCCTHLTQLELVKPLFCADTKDYTMALEYTGGMPRDYILTFDYHGRQNGFHDVSHKYTPYEVSENYATIPVNFDYSESQYIVPNGYECRVLVVDTCERPFKYELIDTINVRYPSWIVEQHLSNTFTLLNDKYNGGYIFSQYQWYANDKPIIGATQSYISVYTEPSENVAYSALVVRENDGVGALSCPIYLKVVQTEDVITEHYILVKPTVISAANPTTYIEGNIGGFYTIYDIVGRKLCSNTFEEGATIIDIPVASSQALFLRVTLNDGSEETFILLVQ